jgi:TolA-binding protein
MREKSILTRVILFLLLSLSLSGLFGSALASATDLTQAKDNIITLIKSGQIESARQNVEKLITDFSQDVALPEALYEIARNLGWSAKHEEEKTVYQQIIQNYPNSLIAGKASLGCAKAQVQALITSQSFDDAQAALDKLTADFANHPDLADALYWIAERYGFSNKYEEEKELCQQIIQKYPGSSIAGKARLGYQRAEVQSLIVSQDYSAAEEAFDKLVADFNGNPDLPETLYWIARRYEWSDKYEEAKNIFEQIVQKYPKCSRFDKARLGVCRMNICCLCTDGQLQAAQDEISKMLIDFSGHPDLPETLRLIARRYEWSDRYKEAKNIYERIIQKYPDSSYAEAAKLDILRAGVRHLIVSQDYNDANLTVEGLTVVEEAIDKLIADFNGNPDLPEALYWIAQRYGYSGRFEEEKNLYQYIMANYPDSSFADKAKLDSAGTDVLTLVVAGNNNDANTALDRMIGDFNGHPYLPDAMLFIVDKYYEKVLRPTAGQENSNKLYRFVMEVLEKRVLDRIAGKDNEAEAYYRASIAAYRLDDPDKIIDYAEKVLQTDPNFRYAPNMQWFVANGYERLKDAGKIPAEDADLIIEETYQELMDKYPASKIADFAAMHMGVMNLRRGNRVKACAYFGWYLMNASPDGMQDARRMEMVKRVLEGCGR